MWCKVHIMTINTVQVIYDTELMSTRTLWGGGGLLTTNLWTLCISTTMLLRIWLWSYVREEQVSTLRYRNKKISRLKVVHDANAKRNNRVWLANWRRLQQQIYNPIVVGQWSRLITSNTDISLATLVDTLVDAVGVTKTMTKYRDSSHYSLCLISLV